MVKRVGWIAVLIVLVLGLMALTGVAGAEGTSGTCGNGVTWALDSETHVLTVRKTGSGDGQMTSRPEIQDARSVTSIVVEEGVTSIYSWAFEECYNVTSLTFPAGLEDIGWGYNSYTKLTDVTFGGIEMEWNTLIRFYPNSPIANATVHCMRSEENAQLTTSFSSIRANGQALIKGSDGTYTIANFQKVAFDFSGAEKTGYTKRYFFCLNGDGVSVPANAGGGVSDYTRIFSTGYAPDETFTVQVKTVYTPDHPGEETPVLIGNSEILTFRFSEPGNLQAEMISSSAYIKGGNGYTVRVTVPRAALDASYIAWGMYVIDKEEYNWAFRQIGSNMEGNAGIGADNTFTVDDNMLEAGKKYRVIFYIDATGYKEYYSEKTLIVADASAEIPAVEWAIQTTDGTTPQSYLTATEYRIQITPTQNPGISGLTALMIWDNGAAKMLPIDNGTIAEGGAASLSFTAGTHAIAVYGTRTPVPQSGSGWKSLDWSIVSATGTIEAEAPHGQLESVRVTMSGENTYKPETDVLFSIGKVEYAQTYEITVTDDYGLTCYTETLNAATFGSETSKTITLPAADLCPASYYNIQVQCTSPGYTESTGGNSFSISGSLKELSGMEMDGSDFYIKKAEPKAGDGFTFTVFLPEEVRNTVVQSWSVYLYDSEYNQMIYRKQMKDGEALPGSFTIPDSVLESGETYNVNFEIKFGGYEYSYCGKKFLVTAPASESPNVTITLTDGDGNVIDNPVMNNVYSVLIQGGENVNRLRVWNGYEWSEHEGNSWKYVTRIRVESETAGWIAEASSDGGETWNAGYNARIYQFSYTDQLEAPAFSTDKSIYNRGEAITLTIGKTEHATVYRIQAETERDEYGKTDSVFYQEEYTDGDGEGTLTVAMPTDHMSAGNYKLMVTILGEGWKKSAKTATFTINEDGTVPQKAVIRVAPENPTISDTVQIYAFVPGAQKLKLVITNAKGDPYYTSAWRELYRGYYGDEFGSMPQGTYTFTIYADGDEKTPATTPATIEVSSKGTLETVTVSGIPSMIGTKTAIGASFESVENAEYYTAEILRVTNDPNQGPETILNERIDAGEEETLLLNIPGTCFTEEGEYYARVRAWADGWGTSGWHEYRFLVLDPEASVTNRVQLAMLDEEEKETEQREWYSSESIRIRVTATEATAVRIWSGRSWTYPELTNGTAVIYTSFSESGDYSAIAQARTGEGAWGRTSEVLTFHVTRRVLPEPAFTSNITEEPVQRGGVIRITIGDDPDIGEEDDENFSYYASLYATAAGEETYIRNLSWNSWTRQILIPTDQLASGTYRLAVNVSAQHWESGQKQISFTIAGEQPSENFRVSSTEVFLDETIEIIHYAAGAQRTGVFVRKGESLYTTLDEYAEAGVWDYTFEDAGTYTLTPFFGTSYVDDEGYYRWTTTEGTPVAVNVTARGTLEPITFTEGTSGIVWAGSDFEASFTQVGNAEKYTIRLASTGTSWQDVYTTEIAAGVGETVSVHIDKQYFTAGEKYCLDIYARASGYNKSEGSIYLIALNRTDNAPTVTLCLLDRNQNETTRTQWYTAESFTIRAETEASQIRLWCGNYWEDCEVSDGVWTQSPGFPEGTYSFVAMTQNQDGTWSVASNIITVQMTRRRLPAPAFTTNITEGTLQKGSMIRILIGEDPDIGDENAQFSYSAWIGRITESGEETMRSYYWDDQKRKIVIPTYMVDTGTYRLHVNIWSSVWDSGEASVEFNLTGTAVNVLVLPENLTGIEANAFEGGAFEAVIIPDGCAYVREDAFKDCHELVYVSYPTGMTFIGNAFDGCSEELIVETR